MPPPPPPPPDRPARARALTGFELAIVVVVALAVVVPGLWNDGLIDPWETHYGEVARRMRADHDWVRTAWSDEGFRSKPVLTFWMQAAAMRALGVADDGGFSGELTTTPRAALAVRLPMALWAAFGLVALWWMLARLGSRRLAWLGLGVVATCPFYLLVARQGITDMTLVGPLLGALSCLALAVTAGTRPPSVLWRGSRPGWALTSLHLVGAGLVLVVAAQALYYLRYFADARLARGVTFPAPALVLPGAMAGLLLVILSGRVADALGLARLRQARQAYLLGFYLLLGLSVLGKGLPALGLAGLVALFYVLLRRRWRALWAGEFELVRGALIVLVVAVPWHLAMYLVDGKPFAEEYFVHHLWNRVATGVFGDRGTFRYYLGQLGPGLWPWAGLVPAALTALVVRPSPSAGDDAPADTLRLLIGLWAITTVAFFTLVQTKFHHYILPAVPALALAVAVYLDDLWTGRARLGAPMAALAAAIGLLVTRDLVHEPDRLIELASFRYDRPWPDATPWQLDVSDGVLGLGLASALAALVLATRWRRLGVLAVLTSAAASAGWVVHAYLPAATPHWGMRDVVARYYQERAIHGVIEVYADEPQFAQAWAPRVAQAVRVGQVELVVRTVVPDALHEGQPMTVQLEIGAQPARVVPAVVRAVGRHQLTLALDPAAVRALQPVLTAAAGRQIPPGPRPPPLRLVDGDRLLAWQLYWRGENFWTGDEIAIQHPSFRTVFKDTDNAELLRYLGDPRRARPGRTYYVLTEAARLPGLQALLPTARARDSFELIDTRSNKFWLGRFTL